MTLFEGFAAKTFGLEFFLFWSEDVIKTTEHFFYLRRRRLDETVESLKKALKKSVAKS